MKSVFVYAIAVALAGSMPARAEDAQGAGEVRWVSAERGASTLLPQLTAVYKIMRLRLGLPADAVTVDTVQVDALADEASQPKGDCRFMEVPGSRIRAERCYHPSEGEAALNNYQFQEEIRFIREQQDIVNMQRAMIEEELKAYEARQQALQQQQR